MRILVVSWYMPPFRTMGALRVGKLCKFLDQAGHDIRVLSCADLPYLKSVPLEISEDRITRTGSIDVNAIPKAVQKLRVGLRGNKNTGPSTVGAAAVPPPASSAPQSGDMARPGFLARCLRTARLAFQNLLNFPDQQIGWLPAGIRGGQEILKDWQPDLIFASAPPFTTLLIGRSLSQHSGIPMVVEYRDRFVEDPYGNRSDFRKKLIKCLEDWWMKNAIGIVTVSEPWAEAYRARFGLPVVSACNGFDPDDFPADYPRKLAPTPDAEPTTLNIVYTGILYPERRDPSPLFEAIALLGEEGKNIRVSFYGSQEQVLTRMAREHGVLDRIMINEAGVPYAESIELQMNADILLLLQWNDPKEQGNVPGKLFEYLGARRPVLGIGLEDGVPAQILRERDVGVVVNDPQIIAEHLRKWLAEKREKGGIPLMPLSAREGYSRPEQYAAVEAFLKQVVGASA